MIKLSSFSKYQKIALAASIIIVPVIVYFYFLKWKTLTIYGDDLSFYTTFTNLKSLSEITNAFNVSEKYRPIQGLAISFLTNIFQHNVSGYYFFNVAIQVLITLSFALIVDLFLRSFIYSLFISLTLGLCRFAVFNVTQLLGGGVLEGLALLWFLLSLFFILRTLVNDENDISKKQNGIVIGTVFANLAIYTHERYLVIIPFVILLILFFPGLKRLSIKQRITLILINIISVGLYAGIKKYIHAIPFLGTGNGNTSFSVYNGIQFLIEGILSILQVNIGPSYLIGIPFSSLPLANQILSALVCLSAVVILIIYLAKVFKSKNARDYNFFIFVFLAILFFFHFAPVVLKPALEQRWLQAPLSIIILMIVIAVSSLNFEKEFIKKILLSTFVLLFMLSDYNYLAKGANNLYFKQSEKLASNFKRAVNNGNILETTDNLYIWEKQKDINSETSLKWALSNGDFFNFYQNKPKKIMFLDSTDSKINVNQNADQVVYLGKNNIVNLTNLYLQDSIPQILKK